MMAVTRMISIIKPFFRVKFRWVICYLIFYAIYMSFGNAGSLVITGLKAAAARANQHPHDENSDHTAPPDMDLGHHGNHLDLTVATIENLNKFVCFVMNVIHCFLGILCSFVTVVYLRCLVIGSAEQARKLKSCTTILIMNIPYIISIISNFLAFYQVIGIDFKLVNHYMLPVLTSAFNPCVIVTRTKALKVALTRSLKRRCSFSRNSVHRPPNNVRRYSARTPIVVFENPSINQETIFETEETDMNNGLELIGVVASNHMNKYPDMDKCNQGRLSDETVSSTDQTDIMDIETLVPVTS